MAEEQGTPPGAGEGAAPSEEEMRAQLDEEIRKVKVDDVILQSLVSILNLAARRIAKEDERDLDQGKQGIDAATALLDFVPEEPRAQIKQAISELQILYAKGGVVDDEPGAAQASPEAGSGSGAEPSGETPPEKPGEKGPGLWTPHQR